MSNQTKNKQDTEKAQQLEQDVLEGLQNSQVKILPSKLLYDDKGSELFDQITQLPEYYITNCEQKILDDNIEEINDCLKQDCLIEYGSGSSTKTQTLLSGLSNLRSFFPIDISTKYLKDSVKKLNQLYPQLYIHPICCDYCQFQGLPKNQDIINQVKNKILYFSGSSIGNLHKHETLTILKQIGQIIEPTGALLIGIDLKKSPQILHPAYNDSQKVTAQFNLNLLTRLNKELNLNFDVNNFKHYAPYNIAKGRMEMHLVNMKKQNIQIKNQNIVIEEGESIWTESSYKYTIQEFQTLAKTANLQPQKVWTDSLKRFSMHYLKLVK